ncbi:hypothetical protein BJ508DRAFT_329786 [Ascobolus immersus RN42]|uniref:Uncharacterized protein n=1 Tax=Ascobolus immersus RN42 TaxID=1160509 RepID=A0A3N4I102_ASCIM|nr:hypothetical protein BJ508DRAFT_329786 [Ascobolus immersus RN42]
MLATINMHTGILPFEKSLGHFEAPDTLSGPSLLASSLQPYAPSLISATTAESAGINILSVSTSLEEIQTAIRALNPTCSPSWRPSQDFDYIYAHGARDSKLTTFLYNTLQLPVGGVDSALDMIHKRLGVFIRSEYLFGILQNCVSARSLILWVCAGKLLRLRKSTIPVVWKGVSYPGPDLAGHYDLKKVLMKYIWDFVKLARDKFCECGGLVGEDDSDDSSDIDDDDDDDYDYYQDCELEGGESDWGDFWTDDLYEAEGGQVEDKDYGEIHRKAMQASITDFHSRNNGLYNHGTPIAVRKISLTSIGGRATAKWVGEMETAVQRLDTVGSMGFTWCHFDVDMPFQRVEELQWECPMAEGWKERDSVDEYDMSLIKLKSLEQFLEVRRRFGFGWLEFWGDVSGGFDVLDDDRVLV